MKDPTTATIKSINTEVEWSDTDSEVKFILNICFFLI